MGNKPSSAQDDRSVESIIADVAGRSMQMQLLAAMAGKWYDDHRNIEISPEGEVRFIGSKFFEPEDMQVTDITLTESHIRFKVEYPRGQRRLGALP